MEKTVSKKAQGGGSEKITVADVCLDFFSSLRLTIVLLICLALFSIVGTLILQKQQTDPEEFFSLYPQHSLKYRILQFFDLFDVYHSWWFRLALLLLLANVVVCSLRRLRRILNYFKPPGFDFDRQTLKDEPLSLEVAVPLPNPAEALRVLHEAMPKSTRIYPSGEDPVKIAAENSKVAVFLSRTGVYFAHFSLLIIFVGVMMGSMLGFSGFVELGEGEETKSFMERDRQTRRELGFTLQANRIWREFYPNGEVKHYFSDLSVSENGKEIEKKVIRVNDPLQYKGIWFYQSSLIEGGVKTVLIRVEPKDGSPPEEHRVGMGDSFTCLTGKYRVQALEFLPDFALDQGNAPFSRSSELRNPAVRLEIRPETGDPIKVWRFLKFPDFHVRAELDANFTFASLEAGSRTGLEVAYDPGTPLIWVGSILLVAGMLFSFYTSHKRYYGIISKKNGKISLLLTGKSNRLQASFEREFQNLSEKLKAVFSRNS